MTSITGKWALVTGSSRGIGQQIALGLARRGCNVIVHGRDASHLTNTLNQLAELGVETHVTAGDLGSAEGVQQVIDQAKAAPGPVDILYNNAAISGTSQPILSVPQEEWDRIFQVNVWAMIALCQAFAPGMRERGYGRIVNLTSGIANQPNLAAYSVSKAAVDKFSRDLAAEFKDENVRVNYIDPGWLQTDMGGKNAMHAVETVLPGAIVPALVDENGPNGQHFSAQDFKYLNTSL